MKTDTHFAPPERADWETLYQQLMMVGENRALKEAIFNAAEPVFVLNTHRQIVYANQAGQALLCPDQDPATLYSCRPGEVMQCVHAEKGIDGCGTSHHCRICKALNTVLKSLQGQIEIQQCKIHTRRQSEPEEFILLSMPLNVHHERFALVSILQIEGKQQLASHAFAFHRMAAGIESC